MFLDAFLISFPSCPFQNLRTWSKTHPFLSILHVFAPQNDVRTWIAWFWKTTLIIYVNLLTRMISNFKYKWSPGHFLTISVNPNFQNGLPTLNTEFPCRNPIVKTNPKRKLGIIRKDFRIFYKDIGQAFRLPENLNFN